MAWIKGTIKTTIVVKLEELIIWDAGQTIWDNGFTLWAGSADTVVDGFQKVAGANGAVWPDAGVGNASWEKSNVGGPGWLQQ